MRILCWGTYDTSKPRARILISGLRQAGAEVTECHVDIWGDVVDKSQIRGFVRQFALAVRWLLAYPPLVWRLIRAEKPDLILVGFPGILDVLIAAPLARLRGVPIAWDMFMSIFDTVAVDRKLVSRDGLAGRLLHRLEASALRRCDFVFMDTRAHAKRIEALFALPRGCIGAVWVGVEKAHFTTEPIMPVRVPRISHTEPLRVLFYGQFIPLHGIEVIIGAARLTQDKPVAWRLIGTGQETGRIEHMLLEQPLANVDWHKWVNYSALHNEIAEADVCLGIFGQSEKAASVIPNKVFQIVAMSKPLITRDSEAIRELLDSGPPCVTLVPPGNAEALADAVACFLEHPRPVMRCHTLLMDRIGSDAVGKQCLEMLMQRFRKEPL